MTPSELSLEFDLLYNNISSNIAPGLSEYEKSALLTQAQESLLLDIYNGNNSDSFEKTEAVTRYMSNLVRTEVITNLKSYSKGLSSDSILITFPEGMDKIWFITYESCNNDTKIVVPTTQDEFNRINKNPFKGPSDKRVLRLSINDNQLELIGKDIKSYKVRYIKRPKPIILTDLEEGISINGETTATVELEAPESLHQQILMRAIQLAKAVWAS